MNKKILLISANRHRAPYPVYPIGVSYLSTYLKKALGGYEVLTFDMNFGTLEELGALIDAQQPGYIGLSLRNIDGANSFDRTGFVPDYEQITKQIRRHSRCPLILGGAGFSVYAHTLFDLLQPDFAVKGEGEKALVELISALDGHTGYEDIEGLLYRDKQGAVALNDRKKFARKLSVDFDDGLIGYYWERSGMLNIQTKRGCYYKCIYCSYPLIEGTCVRCLDSDEIVENLEKLSKEKGINYVFFTDSIFNIKNDYNVALAEKIIRKNLPVRWAAYFSPSNITDEEMALYKRSGLSHIEFGTESFSDTQLVNYGKSFTFDTVRKTSELALKHNVFYAHFLILGGYGETEQTLEETFENARKLRYTVMFPFVGMRIYPGTVLQRHAIREGVISEKDTLLEPAYYISKHIQPATLKERAKATGKAWIFADDLRNEEVERFRTKRNRKGLIWEYLRLP
ncbi:MAG: radical SAM protein [Prevotellaceae bacterium]|jgi:radical SAM superfamily enzyme YgiQ (UPF0313 family)|nr:radical SAM protein [Prevotellaceae bacterium]